MVSNKLLSLIYEKFNNESFFITGASGLFGKLLIKTFDKANKVFGSNIKLTLLTRNMNNLGDLLKICKHTEIKLIEDDIRSFVLKDNSIDRIFHLANTSALETFHKIDDIKKFEVLVDGTKNILKNAINLNIKKILFTSSGVVYGNYSASGIERVGEEYFGAPCTANTTSTLGEAKRTAELLLHIYKEKYKFDIVIARCFSFVGPELPLKLHYAIGNFINDALLKRDILVKGNGRAVRSYMYLEDLNFWLIKLMSHDCKYTIYNVGSDEEISIINLANHIRDILSPTSEVIVQNRSFHEGNFTRSWYVPNVSRIKEEFKLKLGYDLTTSIQKTADKINNYVYAKNEEKN